MELIFSVNLKIAEIIICNIYITRKIIILEFIIIEIGGNPVQAALKAFLKFLETF